MAEDFRPRYLQREQVQELYHQALVQAEAHVANAWINLQLAPHDPTRRAGYDQAVASLEALETDLHRVAGAPITAPPDGPSPALLDRVRDVALGSAGGGCADGAAVPSPVV